MEVDFLASLYDTRKWQAILEHACRQASMSAGPDNSGIALLLMMDDPAGSWIPEMLQLLCSSKVLLQLHPRCAEELL